MSPRTQRRVSERVRLTETYGLPHGWSMTYTLRFGAALEKLPEEERGKVLALLLAGGAH